MGITHHSLRLLFVRYLRVACAHKQLRPEPEHFSQWMGIFVGGQGHMDLSRN